MRKTATLFILAFTLFSITTQASQRRKVLFIGIDGTRSDALQRAHTPNIDSLFAQGLSTHDAWCLGITISGPSWSTMMTGTWFDKHGVKDNTYDNSDFNTYPYFTNLAKQLKPNLYCAEICEWPELINFVYNDQFNLKLHVPDGQGPTTATVADSLLRANDNLDFLFVYFDQVDLSGHHNGFDPDSSTYINAIENVDSCVGVVINALHSRANYANEDWLILLCTDHGGIGKGHGGNTDQERHIWWAGVGNQLQNVTPTGVDPGTYNLFYVFNPSGVDTAKMHQTPVQSDIAVTALHWLIYDTGLRPETRGDWNLDGKSWLKDYDPNANYYPTAVTKVENDITVKIYPNPVSDILTAYFTNNEKADVSAVLFDLNGKEVRRVEKPNTPNKLNMNVKGLAPGNYLLQLNLGQQTVARKVTVE